MFKPIESFQPYKSNYYLLPFRFIELNNNIELLVSEVGDFLFCPKGTSQNIVERNIDVGHPIFADLLSKFIISTTPIPDLIDLIATRYRTKKAFLDNFTSLHIIVVTRKCNQSCIYCQVNSTMLNKDELDISELHLDNILDLIFKSPSQSITIEFQGGEPLLAFNKIVYAVKKANVINEYYHKRITFVICTNLYKLPIGFLSFCKDINIVISTSLDGPEYVHNINRKTPENDSFNYFCSNLEIVQNFLGEDKVSALLTMSKVSLQYPLEIINQYRRLGFSNIFIRALNPYGRAQKDFRGNIEYLREYIKFYEISLNYIIDLNKGGTLFTEEYARIILSKILTPFSVGFTDLQSPAGVINSVIVYDYDGFVYPSDEARMIAYEGDTYFRLGHVNENTYEEIFYGQKAQEISAYWANEALAGCSECAFQSYCGADPIRNYIEQGDMYGIRAENLFCFKNMNIIKILFESMNNDKENTKIFRKWVNR